MQRSFYNRVYFGGWGMEGKLRFGGDRWLLTPPIYKSNTLLGGLDRNSVVASLKDQGTKGWNLDLIKKVFSEDEGHAISNIPLSPLLPQD
jgi:hypothetical protein